MRQNPDRFRTRGRRLLLAGAASACLAALAAADARAQEPPQPPQAAAEAEAERIETRADRLEYNRTTGWVEAIGNVVVRKGAEELRADYVRVNANTEQVQAFGNVVLRRGNEVWRGKSARYNFKTQQGDIDSLTMEATPYRIIGSSKAERGPNDTYKLYNTSVTTCSNDASHVHYRVGVRELTVVPKDHLNAKGAVWYFGPVPVFWLPYWHRPLDEASGLRLRPGYSSRLGAFLLSSYRYRLAPELRAETHVDYRTERGVAGGQDLRWNDDKGNWGGDLSAYYADDRAPLEGPEARTEEDVESERYRLRLRNSLNFTERDYLLLRANYLSDPYMLEDFFEREYREGSEPDNFISYSHRGETYTAGILARSRLNDFYTTVNRLPEATLDLMRREVGDTGIYYESQNSLSLLDKTWAEGSDAQDYDSGRFDSQHLLFRPFREFGFLNLVPRAGYRATAYSQSRETETTTQTIVTPTNTYTASVSQDVDGGAVTRSLVELGLETSFKAFKTWDGPNGPLRHILEPYADYTLVPEPNVTPDELYQFDRVDALGEENYVRFGARNKLQTKEEQRPWDILDLDVYTLYRFERPEDEEPIEDLFGDLQWTPTHVFSTRFEAQYNMPDAELRRLDARGSYTGSKFWAASLEYLYKLDSNSLLAGELTLSPNRRWSYNAFARQEFEEGRLEEAGGYVQRNLDCLVVRLGGSALPGYDRSDGSEVDDEYRAIFELWLTAFPEKSLSSGGMD